MCTHIHTKHIFTYICIRAYRSLARRGGRNAYGFGFDAMSCWEVIYLAYPCCLTFVWMVVCSTCRTHPNTGEPSETLSPITGLDLFKSSIDANIYTSKRVQ